MIVSDEGQITRIEVLTELQSWLGQLQYPNQMVVHDVGLFDETMIADSTQQIIIDDLDILYLAHRKVENKEGDPINQLLVRYEGKESRRIGFGWLTLGVSAASLQMHSIAELATSLDDATVRHLLDSMKLQGTIE